MLQQVTFYVWKDLYPLVEATMQEEWQRLREEQDTSFGKCLAPAVAEIEGVLADNVRADKDGNSGAASNSTESKPLLVT